MMAPTIWEWVGALLAVITPLVAVPLTVITFYLRSLREHQLTWHAELVRRIEACESFGDDLRKGLAGLELDYATKEEWLRECMHTRRIVEQLTEATIRIETTLRTVLGSGKGLTHRVVQTGGARPGSHVDADESGWNDEGRE
ncbi:MAG: hypothetical protein IIB72_04185 [Proteobacteria bacterium]|nr:hypothetical protein [Pseudomonadota bacterium]